MDRSWAFWRRVAVDRVRQTVSLLQRLRGLTEKHKGHKEGSSNASGSVHCCCLLPLALFDNEFGWYAQGASAANKTLERYPLRKKCAVALTCPSASHDAREGGRVEAGAKPLRRTLVWRMKLLPAVTGYKSSAIAAVTKKSNRRANLDWQNSGLCSGTWTNFSPGMCSGMYWNICSAIKEILAFKRAQNQALIWYILGVSLVIDVLHA